MKKLFGTFIVFATMVATSPAQAEFDAQTGQSALGGATLLGLGCTLMQGTGKGCLKWAAGGAALGVVGDQINKKVNKDRRTTYYYSNGTTYQSSTTHTSDYRLLMPPGTTGYRFQNTTINGRFCVNYTFRTRSGIVPKKACRINGVMQYVNSNNVALDTRNQGMINSDDRDSDVRTNFDTNVDADRVYTRGSDRHVIAN